VPGTDKMASPKCTASLRHFGVEDDARMSESKERGLDGIFSINQRRERGGGLLGAVKWRRSRGGGSEEWRMERVGDLR
jgi:hypothetical protein